MCITFIKRKNNLKRVVTINNNDINNEYNNYKNKNISLNKNLLQRFIRLKLIIIIIIIIILLLLLLLLLWG